MKKKHKILGKDDYLVTAYPQYCAGPGWANTPVWLIIKNNESGKLREECIQPNEFSKDMHLLFNVALSAHNVFLNAVNKYLLKGE